MVCDLGIYFDIGNSIHYYFAGNACSSADRECSHICENTRDSYVCKCNAGFRLLDDMKTCVEEDSAEGVSNEVNGTVLSS